MAGIAGVDVIAVWERHNRVDLSSDHRRTLVDHPDTHALTQMPYALVMQAAHLAREDNHHGQLRLREWLNRAASLAAAHPGHVTAGPATRPNPSAAVTIPHPGDHPTTRPGSRQKPVTIPGRE